MGSFQFSIEYDPAILTYTGVTGWHEGIIDVLVGNPSTGHLTFVWAAGLEGINIPDGGFFDLQFNWLSSDGLSTDVTWSDNPTPREFADYNGNIFIPEYVNGTENGFGVGIPENDASSIRIFPNPAINVLNIIVPGDIVSIKLLNPLGVVVRSEDMTGSKTVRLDTGNLGSGSYILQATSKDGNIVNRKVVVTK
jgi:hypothetical protein